MAYLTVGLENSEEIKIHYNDFGEGRPLVLIHGYPFSASAWEKEEAYLLECGHRVISYDRRGFGLSSHPSANYNYDVFASDLNKLMNELNLYDAILIGHSMGSGEITRYLSKYGNERVSGAIFISPIPPFLLKTDDNSEGVDQSVFDDIKKGIKKDRYAYLTEFLKNFYSTDRTMGHYLSQEKLRADFNLASMASPIATYKCVDTWLTDFRNDLPRIQVPCLIIQGDDDRILPLAATGERLAKELEARLVTIPEGSHGIPWTHAELINEEIIKFMEGVRPNPKREQRREQNPGAQLQ
jgi:non-heme chloroperoxidase